MNIDLSGANTLALTPFTAAGALDFSSLRRLLNYVIEGGAKGIISLGSTGEFFGLSHDERLEVISATTAIVESRVPLTVGVGSDGTAETISLVQAAERSGADCVMVTPPIYFDSPPSAQVQHFTAVAASTELPVMLYDGSNGIRIHPDVLTEVNRRSPNVKYIKVATQDPAVYRAYVAAAPSVVPIVGDDMLLLQGLRAGGSGSATAIGNVLPHRITALHAAHICGRMDVARAIAQELAPFTMRASIPKGRFIANFKFILREIGILESAATRAPLVPLQTREADELLEDLLPLVNRSLPGVGAVGTCATFPLHADNRK